ncbi:NAD(P)H-binding protein [Pontibacter anaerobius]|uniref:NAD(P)H-binding protein n=1 Tax=Pontibacter anaerobius TaxID=2993940 RepID=A0ABT3RK11_9BACT|nr:NAD(P)H-binding protein [Pontibacter anaerobius]MCX2742187.1 NAD(P)H-binding protein [Pontibacter anaerobius]
MESNYILVLGAGGNIGGKVAQELVAQGAQVGVVGRSRSRLSRFEGKAEILEGDFSDDVFLHHALQKASSLFLTVPNDVFSDVSATARRLARLLQGTAVTHIVNISNSIIRRAGKPTGLVALEEELNKCLPQHLLHLRCGNFFENLNWGLHTPYLPDLKLPYISSYEVAHTAAQHLLQQDFTGKQAKALLGERDYSMAELAAAAGVTYQQLPYTSENIHFYKPFNESDFEVEPRSAKYEPGREERFTLKYFLIHDLKQNL